MRRATHVLPIIIFSQFACTSLWFAGNAIIDDLAAKFGYGSEIAGNLLSMVQFGFISGTLIFAFLLIADRFHPSKVFLVCAILGAVCNLPLLAKDLSPTLLLTARFATGFFLAGIYPVGMKIASDYFEKGLGKALGFLVGALVLGSSAPFLLNALKISNGYSQVIWATSILSIIGGMLVGLTVAEGPYRRPMAKFQPHGIPRLFKISAFRKAAFGYFGHMWELYAFWAFTPVAITFYNKLHATQLSSSIYTFTIIALGGIACGLGGLVAQNTGSKKVAQTALSASGILCCVSPLLFTLPPYFFLFFWMVWGMFVAADSPQFSTLVAEAAPTELKGTALTLSNCLGFAISIISIQLLNHFTPILSAQYAFLVLALGPVLGILYFRKI